MSNLLLFIALIVGGVFTEILVFRLCLLLINSKLSARYLLIKYCYLLAFPMLAVFVILQRSGIVIGYVFLISALAGTLLELFVGFSYRHIIGERLWTYHRYTLTKYTSLFSIPLWGLAGVLLWLVAQLFA